MTSDVMDAGNGEYLISARASTLRGGSMGAKEAAYKDATAFCAPKGGHAVIVEPSAANGGSGPSATASVTIAAGRDAVSAELRFRCSQ